MVGGIGHQVPRFGDYSRGRSLRTKAQHNIEQCAVWWIEDSWARTRSSGKIWQFNGEQYGRVMLDQFDQIALMHFAGTRLCASVPRGFVFTVRTHAL